MKIYCDMDMVLCDFLRAAETLTGEPFPDKNGTLSKDQKKQMITEKKDFWPTLPWTTDGRKLWKALNSNPDNQVMILSAHASWDKNCKPGKRAWIKKNLRPSPSRIYLVRRDEKQNFADKDSILVDDYARNTNEFYRAGGYEGLTHINTNSTISQLKKLGVI